MTTKREEAQALFDEGVGVREISRRLDVPDSTVSRWTSTAPPRSMDEIKAESQERQDRAVELYRDGLSASKIGEEIGISKMQVTRLLRRAGVLLALLVVGGAMFAPSSTAGVRQLVRHAHGHPHACNAASRSHWSQSELKCVASIVAPRFGMSPRTVWRIGGCESQHNVREVTPPYSASGWMQFLPSTWRGLAYRGAPGSSMRRLGRTLARKSVFDPVYNLKAMGVLFVTDGHSYREWTCAYLLGIR